MNNVPGANNTLWEYTSLLLIKLQFQTLNSLLFHKPIYSVRQEQRNGITRACLSLLAQFD